MNLITLAVKLESLLQSGAYIFVGLEPEIIDFTRSDFYFKFKIISEVGDLNISITPDEFLEITAFVKTAIFNNKDVMIIGWDLKTLFSAILFKTGVPFEIESKFLDLKVAECFIGIREKPPINFEEMKNRVKVVFTDSSWSKFKSLYQKIYLPLITEVLPFIESEGFFDSQDRKMLYPCYDVSGQVNGRMSCSLAYENCINPHSMSAQQKAILNPKNRGCSFLHFDFNSMEVCTLAWLSGDKHLSDLVNGEEDFYRSLFKLISGAECDTDEKRNFCKKIFLPVFYGESAKELAKNLNFSVETAFKVIDKLKTFFPKVFSWANEYEHENECVDFYGRKRRFSFEDRYKYRNFIIQSPASIICLDRLVRLHCNLGSYGKLVAHIHDGYIVKTSDNYIEIVKSLCIDSLQSESQICPGLNLKTNFKIGKTLA
jgi:hypothetical protein